MKQEHKHIGDYRPNVCAVILHPMRDDAVLLCHRKDFLMEQGWQFPQGGYDEDKDLIEEMKRELREEISTDAVEVLQMSAEEYFYAFPSSSHPKRDRYLGQRQRWVLCRFVGQESDISVETKVPEFDEWKWASPHEAARSIVEFKKTNYYAALREFGLIE
ncbi:RNA pyrophosphohydrolase [Chitinivibrio alkaliphilus]|uniref:NUDIX hydrolase n=1 Tax=Chitinivibrio alkaliphilus ACht1 TaxID=1313304 RepID=U7D788_9BACT|nr:RNA pyrophosphohydrolase [Chitinivibrio alkaliphilus]ERP30957.1 NUDIX hydrolase [Chitinivibrio alkaliphilus ACht1]